MFVFVDQSSTFKIRHVKKKDTFTLKHDTQTHTQTHTKEERIKKRHPKVKVCKVKLTNLMSD